MTQPPQSPYGQGNPVGPGPHGPGGQQYGQQPPGYPTQGGTQQPQPQWQPQPPYGQQWQAPPPGPSSTLQEIGGMRWYVIHGNGTQATNINPHFHGCRATQKIDFSFFESVFSAGQIIA